MPAGCVCVPEPLGLQVQRGLGLHPAVVLAWWSPQPRAVQSSVEAGTAPVRVSTCQSNYKAGTRALNDLPLYGPPALASSDVALQQ